MKVALAPLVQQDAEAIFTNLNLVEITRYLRDLPNPYTLEDAKAFIHFASSKGSSGRDFAIGNEGQFCGVISIIYGTGVHACGGEIGYWICKNFQGMGVATQAISQITEFAFEIRKLARVFAKTHAQNIASCKALENAGFVCEGILRNDALFCGEPSDVKMYSRII